MRTAAVALVLAVAAALAIGSAAAPAAPGARRAIAPPPSLERAATSVTRLAASAYLTGTVVLEPRDGAALTRFIAAVSDRTSPSYGRYLAPGAFAARFGPTAATVAGVETALRAGGLRVAGVSPSRLLIHFSGTAGDVHAAFGTALARYRLANGTRARGTTSAIRLPAALAGSVAAVVGLDLVGAPRTRAVVHPDPSQVGQHPAARPAAIAYPAGAPRPCAAAQAASVAADGLTDDQIANAYGAFGLYRAGDRGAGQHIALYENEPFLRSDIRTFDACYFGRAQAAAMMARLHVIAVDGGQPTGPGSGEASLDVEDVSALAPGATIDVYEGPYTGADPTDYDSLDEYGAIIDADRDRIVSTSWGLCEQSVQQGQPGIQQAENLLFEQAAAQGQTVFSAAGDNGSDDCNTKETPTPAGHQDPLSVDDPSSQPYVVAVGGTGIDNADPRALVEQLWNGGPKGGAGGGGISQSWEIPAWQRATTVPGIALPGDTTYREAGAAQRQFGFSPGFCQATVPGATAATGCRLLPDVSSEGDPYTGSITVYSASYAGTPFSRTGWTTTGGTSSSTPIWAAMLALVNASPSCTARPATAQGIGFASPQLYAVASDPARYRASFNDVTLGNNDVDGIGGGRLFAAGRGFDLASGLGSPRLTGPGGTAGLAYYLCAAAAGGAGRAPAGHPVVTQLSPSFGSVAGGQTLTITGTGFGAGVSAVQIGTRRLTGAEVRTIGPGSIAVTVPPAGVAPFAPAPQDGAGPANVIVTVRGGASSAPGPQATFDYVDQSAAGPLPSVSAISPSGGSQAAPGAVTILGAGFAGATGVTFGGVAARRFHVASGGQITVTPPPLSAATACAPLPATGSYAGESAANDVCQVAVRVENVHGASVSGQIPVPYEGPISTDALGDVVLPPGCGCEGVTAPDEYDYVPAAQITSISTSAGPAGLASEAGTTVITVRGRGLDALTLDWANFGDPRVASSVNSTYRYLSGTELQITAPPHALTVGRASVPFSVKTLAGQSPAARAGYAGVPRVTGVVNLANRRRLQGVYGASDVGGTAIRVLGAGFADQLSGPLRFVAVHGGVSAGTEYRYRVTGASRLQTTTVGQLPGLVDVRACTVSGCSVARPADRLWIYAPGDPSVSSVAPRSGPAAGGTATIIRGADLGCPLAVFFGRHPAKSAQSGSGAGDCGTTAMAFAIAPGGRAGSTVPVSVFTVQSYFAHGGLGTTRAGFHYTR